MYDGLVVLGATDEAPLLEQFGPCWRPETEGELVDRMMAAWAEATHQQQTTRLLGPSSVRDASARLTGHWSEMVKLLGATARRCEADATVSSELGSLRSTDEAENWHATIDALVAAMESAVVVPDRRR